MVSRALILGGGLTSTLLGPIVRIGPREVHVDDLPFFKSVHTMPKVKKDARHYHIASTATVTIHDNKQHHIRRRAISSFYNVGPVEARYKQCISETTSGFLDELKRNKEVNMSQLCRAWAFDTMMRIYLDHDPEHRKAEDYGLRTHWASRDFIKAYAALSILPDVLIRNIPNVSRAQWFLPNRVRLWYRFVAVKLSSSLVTVLH
jgi:hypothetical protein